MVKICTTLLAAVLALGLHSVNAACSTAPNAFCGNDTIAVSCCPDGQYCQPWSTNFYQCVGLPNECQEQRTNTDFYGNDIKTLYGIQPGACCTECTKTPGCVAYTFVNSNPGQPACYLKNATSNSQTKVGAVSGVVSKTPATTSPATTAPATTAPATTAPATTAPPAQCKNPMTDTDLYGDDLQSVNGIQLGDCCDRCATTTECVAYTYADSVCYLKKGKGAKTGKSGAVSGYVDKTPATTAPVSTPPPTTPVPTTTQTPSSKCQAQQVNTDLYGDDLSSVSGSKADDCCDVCAKTDKCVAYTFANGVCYLKKGLGNKQTKTGAISAVLSTTPSCSVAPYGQCGDANGFTCCPVGFYCQPWNPTDYQCVQNLSQCGAQLTDQDYVGNDIKTVYVSLPQDCCNECAKTTGCKAYTYINGNPGQPACYLKSAAGETKRVVGAIAGKLN